MNDATMFVYELSFGREPQRPLSTHFATISQRWQFARSGRAANDPIADIGE